MGYGGFSHWWGWVYWSHSVVLLQEAGYEVVVLDNLSNSNPEVFSRVEQISGRRPGDVAECYADSSYSGDKLNWKAENGLTEMVRDHWKWQTLKPEGYGQSGDMSPSK
ncbi:MAG: hypothetical protein V7731_17705 [Amphritea sp.]